MAGGDVATRRWKPANALGVAAIALASLVVLLLLWKARALFLTVFLAVVVGVSLAHATDWLERHHVRRGLGAPAIMLLVIGALAGLFLAIGPNLRDQSKLLVNELPPLMKKFESWTTKAQKTPVGAMVSGGQPVQAQAQGSAQQQKGGGLQDVLARQARGLGRVLFPVLSSVFEVLAGILIIVSIAIYIGISPRTYREGILHLVPHPHRPRLDELLSEISEAFRGWLQARLIAAVIIGAITAGGLTLLKVEAALALGVIAGLLEFIPFFGPILSAIPAIGVGLVDSPQKALYVALLYLLIQQIEGNVLTPLLLKKRLELPPVVTIVAVSALGMAFGVLGMLVAEPLTAMAMLIVKRLYVRDVVGDEIQAAR